MVNTNIQGVIPLAGRGFTAKIKRNFNPGEYNQLSNMRIEDNILQTRFNIRHYVAEGAAATPIVSAHPFVGFLEEYVITVNMTEQWAYKVGSAKATMWAPTSLPTDGNGSSWHKIVSVFRYDIYWNWITWRYDATTGTSSIWLYAVTLAGKTVPTVTFASLNAIKLFESTVAGFIYDNCFVYKERLWVCTNQGLFFSKATDFSTFAVPNGGFFKLRDQNINYAFGHKENIFILCDSSIQAVSYTVDPNTDGFIREVSNIIGGDHGTSHNDQAYFINSDALYALSSTSIELVRDDFEIGVTTTGSKLVSWDKYLIVTKYSNHNYTANAGTWPSLFKDVGRVRSPTVWALSTLVDSNVYFIDMETGACHTCDFNDQFTGTGIEINERGHITDMVVNPNKSLNRGNVLTLMTNKYSGVAATAGAAQVYFIDNTGDDFFIYDTAVNTATDNIVRRMKPNIKIEFNGYTPDGNEYMMKKFRSLELMGNFAWWDFEVLFAFDNQPYVDAKAIPFIIDYNAIIAAGGAKNSHYPARIGLNQRGRAINILLRTKDPRTPMPGGAFQIYERVQLSDVRLLWTYTGRTPTHITQSATT